MPKLNVSGYRGIWGADLNEQIAYEFGLAFAQLIKNNNLPKKILIGRDARKTGPLILEALKQAFEKEGIEYEYAGIIPTPSILLLVRKLDFGGGIMITASHNPPEYNGMKFINSKGLFATSEQIEEIIKNKENLNKENHFSPVQSYEDIFDNKKHREIHINEILKNIDVEKIKSKKFKVAHDPINSAGSIITLELLKELGCEVYQINKEQTGEFTHMPEPLAINLGQIAQAVKDSNADIGFAQDPDADRLVLVNEKGEIINEEYTLALGIKSVLLKEVGDIVINMSTSKMSEDLATENNVKIFRTKIGEANVVDKMLGINAVAGGEGSGGMIYPKINPARDSLVGIALVLELMATKEKAISKIVNEIPKYFMQKDKIPMTGSLNQIYEKVKKAFPDGEIDSLDGMRLDFPNSSWLHIRPSNTEPIIRIFGEAKTEEEIKALFGKVRLTLES